MLSVSYRAYIGKWRSNTKLLVTTQYNKHRGEVAARRSLKSSFTITSREIAQIFESYAVGSENTSGYTARGR